MQEFFQRAAAGWAAPRDLLPELLALPVTCGGLVTARITAEVVYHDQRIWVMASKPPQLVCTQHPAPPCLLSKFGITAQSACTALHIRNVPVAAYEAHTAYLSRCSRMPSLKILVSSPHSPFQRKKFAIEKAATNLFQGVVATPIFLQNVRRHDFSKHRNRKEAGTEGPRTCLILFRNNHYNADVSKVDSDILFET